LFILNKLAERVGFEFTRKGSFNNIENTVGTVKRWKTVVSSANGSQTDHGSVIKGLTKAVGTLLFYRSTGSFPVEGDPMQRSQRTGFPVADEYKLMPTSPFIGTDLDSAGRRATRQKTAGK